MQNFIHIVLTANIKSELLLMTNKNETKRKKDQPKTIMMAARVALAEENPVYFTVMYPICKLENI